MDVVERADLWQNIGDRRFAQGDEAGAEAAWRNARDLRFCAELPSMWARHPSVKSINDHISAVKNWRS